MRGLAAAGGADQGDGLAAPGLQRHVVQRRRGVAIGEADVLEAQGLRRRRRAGCASGASPTSGSMSMAANMRRAAARPSANTGGRLASWRSDWEAASEGEKVGGEGAGEGGVRRGRASRHRP